MIAWLSQNLAWFCVVWLLGGALVVLWFARKPGPEVIGGTRPIASGSLLRKPPRLPQKNPIQGVYLYELPEKKPTDGEWPKFLFSKIIELQSENARLRRRLLRFEPPKLDAAACDEGMGG